MKKNGIKPCMSFKWLICNGFYKRQAVTLSFIASNSVR